LIYLKDNDLKAVFFLAPLNALLLLQRSYGFNEGNFNGRSGL